MNLPLAPQAYGASNERQTRAALEAADRLAFKAGQDLRLARGERLILKSPNGADWLVGVTNLGAITVTAA